MKNTIEQGIENNAYRVAKMRFKSEAEARVYISKTFNVDKDWAVDGFANPEVREITINVYKGFVKVMLCRDDKGFFIKASSTHNSIEEVTDVLEQGNIVDHIGNSIENMDIENKMGMNKEITEAI